VIDGWVWGLLLVGGGSVAAVFNRWQPWEVVALAGVLGAVGAALAAVAAWQEVRTRALELTAVTTDEQAARLMGEALGRCGPFLSEEASGELWEAFAGLSGEPKRAMALAVVGLIGDSEQYELINVGPQLLAAARGFRAAPDPEPAPTP
jgi:hypothetical protein